MTKAQMLTELQAQFDNAYTEWQISENMMLDMDENSFEYQCVNRCSIREFQECETIARITKQFFGVTLMELFD